MINEIFELLRTRTNFFIELSIQHLVITLIVIVIALSIGLILGIIAAQYKKVAPFIL